MLMDTTGDAIHFRNAITDGDCFDFFDYFFIYEQKKEYT